MDSTPRAPRFARQLAFAGLGPAGQARLERARVAIVGVGALGGAAALALSRAGVGFLRLIDRDLVDESNLPRQVLFDARHAAQRAPKAQAAVETLERAGGPTRYEARLVHLGASALGDCLEDVDLVLDGTDNVGTRYLLNDWCVRQAKAWVHAGVVGSQTRALLIVPGTGGCLRCLFPEPPLPGQLETCESGGVLGPAVLVAAGWQAALALRHLAAEPAERAQAAGRFLCSDVWTGEQASVRAERDPDCPCCAGRRFEYLEQAEHQQPLALCGRNAVQVPGRGQPPDRPRLIERLERSGARELRVAGPLLAFLHEGLRFTLFPDGRCLVEGTEDLNLAQAHCERLLL